MGWMGRWRFVREMVPFPVPSFFRVSLRESWVEGKASFLTFLFLAVAFRFSLLCNGAIGGKKARNLLYAF